MKRAATLLPLLLLAGCSGGKGDAAQPAATVTVPGPTATATSVMPAAPAPAVTTVPPAPPPTAAAGLSDGSFTATSPTGVKDASGICSGTGRITNTSNSEKTAVVTYTLFKGGEQKATLQGSANAVAAGKTATVQLISTSPCGAGPFTFEFQVDTEF